jgi:IclR family pca regulon transcriptional regulator
MHVDHTTTLIEGTARVAVPSIITLAMTIGTRFPALQTSLGKVLLAWLPYEERERALAERSRSGITPRWNQDASERDRVLCEVQARGWALTDEQLAPGIRSIAAQVRDDVSHVVAALNVSVHAAETSIETLTERYLPLLLETADKISADWTLFRHCLQITVNTTACSNAPL